MGLIAMGVRLGFRWGNNLNILTVILKFDAEFY